MNTLFLTDLLYTLRCDWGRGMTFHSYGVQAVDPATGSVLDVYTAFPVSQGIMLPMELARTFAQYLHLGNYQYGSEYDKGNVVVLIEKSQLPIGLVPVIADRILCQGKQYEPKSIVDLIEAWEFIMVELAAE